MYKFTLTGNDQVNFQLFEASTNPVKIKNRRRSFYVLLGLSFFVILFGFQKNDDFLMFYGVFCAVLVLCFGKVYLRWRHKKHYTSQIKNQLGPDYIEDVQIQINHDDIRVVDRAMDSQVKVTEIKQVDEIQEYYFLKLDTGPCLIVPKTDDRLNHEVVNMARTHGIPHVVRLDWKWR